MSQLNRLVLVLNASYEPCNIISAKRAMTLIFKGAAYVEVPSKEFIHHGKERLAIQIPSVVRLLTYRRMPRQNRAVSRKSLFLRDRYTCQYCGNGPLVPKQLTLDHVIPKSRGGGNTWQNMTSCCFPCNNKKGSRTPDEAGMPLLHKPAAVGIHGKHRLLATAAADESWEQFLFV